MVNNFAVDYLRCFIIQYLLVMNSNSELYYRDAVGNFFLVKDVAALGDCAVLSVLCHPNFHAPVTDIQELRRAVVSFAESAGNQDCAVVYTALKPVNSPPFQLYLQQVLQPRFWVGTEFFVWVTMLYGVEVLVHYLDNHKVPQTESTLHFLRSSLPDSRYLTAVHGNPISVFFHQYNRMNVCMYDRYNHFALLLNFPSCPANLSLLINSNLVGAEDEVIPPPKGQVNPPPKEQWWKKEQGKKTVKKKSAMTKVERKQHHADIMTKYLGRMPEAHKRALEFEERLQEARKRALELAEEHQVEVDDLDLPINWSSQVIQVNDASAKSVVHPRSLTPKYCGRSWIQRSYILFIHLHPAIGADDVSFSSKLTGVKENTLIGWLSKPEMVSCWLPVVESLKASDVLGAMPPMYRDCFQDIDKDSTVSLTAFKKKANRFKGQLQINFNGKAVSNILPFIYFFFIHSHSFSPYLLYCIQADER